MKVTLLFVRRGPCKLLQLKLMDILDSLFQVNFIRYFLRLLKGIIADIIFQPESCSTEMPLIKYLQILPTLV